MTVIVTVKELHDQHGKMEQLFSDILNVRMVPEGHPVTSVLLEELVRILTDHWANEEAFMRDLNYPRINGHQWQHAALLQYAESMRERFQQRSVMFLDGMRSFHELLTEHMNGMDAEMFRFAQEQGVF